MQSWKGKEILVIGAARQGLAAMRFLSQQGAKVTLNDGKNESFFSDILAELKIMKVNHFFGSHPLSLLDRKDALCISGGVPLDIPLIIEAQKKSIPLTNDAQIFLDSTTANTIGITGSAGKTTTTTLIGAIAKTALGNKGKAWVGGNIGNPLIEHMDKIGNNDWVVMELSSFQLELMRTSTDIAIVLNITPNHLDRHRTMEAYTNAKAHILDHQTKEQIAILNRDDDGSIALRSRIKGSLLTFGWEKPQNSQSGSFVEDEQIKACLSGDIADVIPIEEIKLPGKHNVMNALAASAAGIAAGFSLGDIAAGIAKVEGIPHRLELVAESNGIRWFNDSIATAPERVIAALDAIRGPLVLLLGGRDKNLPWGDLAAIIANRKPKIILFGEAGEMIDEVLHREKFCGEAYPTSRFHSLEEAVIHAKKIAESGDAVLLSPGGTSYDAFFDFEERGNLFKEFVREIT